LKINQHIFFKATYEIQIPFLAVHYSKTTTFYNNKILFNNLKPFRLPIE